MYHQLNDIVVLHGTAPEPKAEWQTKVSSKAKLQSIVSNADARRQFCFARLRQLVANVAATGNSDPVRTILKVKSWANEVGGLRKLKALVDALSE